MSDKASYNMLGARAMLDRLQEIIKLSSGVKKSRKREKIHQMRVATRRIRAAFSIFTDLMEGKRARKWKKVIRQITSTLGTTRDLDVQLESLEATLSEIKEKRFQPGIERLHLRLTQKRHRMQPKVVRAMERIESSGVIEEMSEYLREVIVEAGVETPNDRSPYVYEQAYRNIMMRAEELIAFDPYVNRPECVTEMHDMRIAAKRLRYSIELFEPVYDERLKKHRKEIRDLQELLGQLHDTDIWLETLPKFIDEEQQRTRAYYGHDRAFGRLRTGLEWLITQREAERKRIYENCVARWGLLQNEKFWDQLRADVRRPLEVTTSDDPVRIEGPSGFLREPDDAKIT